MRPLIIIAGALAALTALSDMASAQSGNTMLDSAVECLAVCRHGGTFTFDESADTTCTCAEPPPPEPEVREAGPIWSQEHAAQTCPAVCGELTWDGGWWTTRESVMSVCSCVPDSLRSPKSVEEGS